MADTALSLGDRHAIVTDRDGRQYDRSIELLWAQAEKPFTIEDLWKPSIFPLQSFPPLETPRWDDNLPSKNETVTSSAVF